MNAAPKWFVILNALLRFLLELAALAVLAWWGWHTGSGIWALLLAVATPLVGAVLWGSFVAPRAKRFLPLPGRLLIEAVVFGSATAALVALGHVPWAVVLAILAAANSTLVHLTRDDERRRMGVIA